MSYVLTTPEMLAAAATDVGNIGTAISTASSNAAGPTTGLLPAAEDEVSAAIAKLFGAYGREYQAVVSQAATFHNEFTQALAAAGNAYLEAEAANSAPMSGPSNTLNTITAPIQPLFGQTAVTGGPSGFSAMTSMARAPSADPLIPLIIGGTGNPTPDPGYVTSIFNAYIQRKTLLAGAIPQRFFTPEQVWPITLSLGNLTSGQSVAQGVNVLTTALADPTGVLTQGNNALVFGYSQSATVATNEITALMAAGSPYEGQLSFMLVGNPKNPVGCILERFTYPTFTAAQVAKAVPLPTSPGYTGSSTQYFIDPGLNFFLGQPSSTGLSVLSGAGWGCTAVDSTHPLTRGG
jgi:PE family protein/PE-PPE domain-containing protein